MLKLEAQNVEFQMLNGDNHVASSPCGGAGAARIGASKSAQERSTGGVGHRVAPCIAGLAASRRCDRGCGGAAAGPAGGRGHTPTTTCMCSRSCSLAPVAVYSVQNCTSSSTTTGPSGRSRTTIVHGAGAATHECAPRYTCPQTVCRTATGLVDQSLRSTAHVFLSQIRLILYLIYIVIIRKNICKYIRRKGSFPNNRK